MLNGWKTPMTTMLCTGIVLIPEVSVKRPDALALAVQGNFVVGVKTCHFEF
jgi:hypothetical protein